MSAKEKLLPSALLAVPASRALEPCVLGKRGRWLARWDPGQGFSEIPCMSGLKAIKTQNCRFYFLSKKEN